MLFYFCITLKNSNYKMIKITPICKECHPPFWRGYKRWHRILRKLGFYKYTDYCKDCSSTLIY